MSTGAVLRSIPTGPAQRRRSCGFSLTELCVCLGIAGVLGGAGVSNFILPSPRLSALQQELDAALIQAFHQARAQGCNVRVALGVQSSDSDVLPVRLPEGVRWGKPALVPLPPGMDDPVAADATGEAHPTITVTPRRTVTATAWFLTDGKDVLCLRLSGHGQHHMLRWYAARRRWGRV